MKINMMQNKIAHTLLRHIVTQQYQFAFFVVVNVHSTLPRLPVFIGRGHLDVICHFGLLISPTIISII